MDDVCLIHYDLDKLQKILDIANHVAKKYHIVFGAAKCKVIKDKKTDKGMGYGFVSLLDCDDYVKAMREMQGKYVGNRPIKLLPSKWTDKSLQKGFGVIKQGNAANLMAKAKGEDSLVFEQEGSQSLAQKYAHLIGPQNV